MGENQPARRRTRRRAAAPQGPPRPPRPRPEPTPPAGPAVEAAAPKTAPLPREQHHRDHVDRGMRDLIGAGRSQLGVSGALRGRDVNRPSEDDLAEAERDVVLVRRHWRPPPA